MHPPPVSLPAKSRFVNAVARVSIALSGLAVLTLWPSDSQHVSMQGSPLALPSSLDWVMGHSAWFFHVLWLLAIATFLSAFGLLRRREWARRAFIATLSVAVVYEVAFVVLEWWWSSSMPRMMLELAGDPDGSVADMRGIVWYVRIMSLLFGVSWAVFFGWIIKRLGSAPVRFEFRPVNASSPAP